MDAAYLSRALDDLAGCARKEKKLKLEKALFVFQKSEVIVTVDLNSELKHLDRTCHVFTWNSCLQIVLKILMNEIQVACRTSKGEPNMNAELQRYFKLLVLVASHGSHGNLVLDLNDLVASFLTVMKEPTLCFVRLPFFRALQWLFQRCASHSISFLSTHWDELIFWCCGQWNDFIDYNSPHLLCLILSHAITTHSVSWDYIWKSVTEFLRR
ncbi:hypothetical protein D915_004104 [Fasciola hepatica]|uniref:Uncharacterized protein n=1 Tax=Fasciola hepatica TaxID=6192 RepID=A0A4E0RC61_FASHE|nr:hypothetical protein D915_004104 [Fasciola hepatica]